MGISEGKRPARSTRAHRLNVAANCVGIAALLALAVSCAGVIEGLNNVDNGRGTPGYAGPTIFLAIGLGVLAFILLAASYGSRPKGSSR